MSTSAIPQPPARASILALGDSEALLKVISYLLAPDYEVTSLLANGRPPALPPDLNAVDLLILAVGAPETEPLVMLGQAGLGCLVGAVPILLITERRFHPAPDSRVYHLDYPFQPDALKQMLQELIDQPNQSA
jgi:hypothetical protein